MQPTRPHHVKRQPRVLIVDDSPTCRAIVTRALAPLEATCDVAESAEMALRMLSKDTYDLVSLDLDLPGVGGEEMLRMLRETQPLLPVLIITGIDPKLYTNAQLYDNGANAILQKPFDEATAYAVAHGLLTGRGSRLWMR